MSNDDLVLYPCPQCASMLACLGCVLIHLRDHMLGPVDYGGRRHGLSFAPLSIPRRHLTWINRANDLEEHHTCVPFRLQAAKLLMRWVNLVLHCRIKAEVGRAAQFGLLRICKPLQYVILKPPGLEEHILRMVAAYTPQNVIPDVLAIQRAPLTRPQHLRCYAACANEVCTLKGDFRCCLCSVSFCTAHVKACGCVGALQRQKSLCRACKSVGLVGPPLPRHVTPQCKKCNSALYYLSKAGRRLCDQCSHAFWTDEHALAHEVSCRIPANC